MKTTRFRLDARLSLLGFCVALFSSGIGIGGGTLLVSILMSAFNYDFKKAASTSLATIVPISLVGAVSHFFFLAQTPDLRYYVVFIPACVLGSLLGVKIVREHQNGWFKLSFSLFLLVLSLRMLKIFDFPALIYGGLYNMLFSSEWLLIVPIGIFIGVLSVCLGIGCGLLIVPFYVIVIGFDISQAITLSLTTMFFLTLSATIVRSKYKALDKMALTSLLFPALVGAVVGVVISGNLPAALLEKLFGVFLFFIACKYTLYEIALYTRPAASVEKL